MNSIKSSGPAPALLSKSSAEELLADYSRAGARKALWVALGALLLALSFLLSISVGDMDIPLADALSGALPDTQRYVLVNIRVLRSLMAMTAGAGLAVAGLVIQAVLKNPMASPFTLGISQGAAFGASFAIIILGGGAATAYGEGVIVNSPYLTVAGAFLGSLAAMAFITFVAFMRNGRTETVILSGIAAGAFFQAMTMLLQYFTTEVKAAAALFWTFGDVSKGNYGVLAAIASVTLGSLGWFALRSWDFNALLWGPETARTLGVDVKKLKVVSVALVAALTAVITSFLGVIGFIGLIAPHIARIFTGHDNRYLVPLSALTGALVLNLSDVLSRVLAPPAVIPVGIITSFWGIVVFVLLILKRDQC